ncbi:hypothetical protein Vretimale_12138 [Volvox reticuliferus]|uniref:Peptidase M43 pregnancy-associated plasma-A domain-containing protein n=1 Tax=Volvox reticuliferus TaxID=1737510 RepID=A0A8J4FLR4_9CHLO|nr:hypothetical protein Vretifemale_9602 [Volvox reticuliferus]GIM08047.1 hypothetical protein Vretimale_12138 [Volvox reticuliferus]
MCATWSRGPVTAQRFAIYLSWLLVTSALLVHGQGISRTLNQINDDIKVVEDTGRRPFLALKDTTHADSEAVQRLYEQSGQASAIAYLLFAAARPLALAEGSSNALLLYLTPTVLRLYTSQSRRCSSPLARQLYDLSQGLYGTSKLQACHYDLYQALDAAFAWVRDNIALQLQEVPGQPLASAMWPDMTKSPAQKLTAAVAAALANPAKLGATALLVNASCGLSTSNFAALVPDISSALKQLHADLPLLQQLAESMHASRWSPGTSIDGDARRRALLEALEWMDRYSGSRDSMHDTNHRNGATKALRAAHMGLDGIRHRRSALTLPSNFYYTFPPSNFVISPPAQMSQLMVPLVFHIMLYKDGTTIGPAKYDQSLQYVQRLVQVANIMAQPAKIQLFIREVRNDPDAYPYLLLNDRATWLNIPLQNCTGTYCFTSSTFMYTSVWDYPRSVNVFIASDSTVGVPLGYAYVGGSDVFPESGHVFVSWDSISFDGSNSLALYDDGPNTLLHEMFHHFGLDHPFDYSTSASGQCQDGDYVLDTPASLYPISSSRFFSTAQAYCMELFWGQYGGDWDATYTRWSSTLGIPATDMNAWADSCPALAGYDELGNYMTYNTPVCFAALGHFTPAQVQRAMLITSELNPVLYAWGQYYAQNAAPPPPMASPPPELFNNTCRSTAKSACPCKAAWQLSGTWYSYCDRTGSTNALTCEVVDPSTCADCTGSPCILACAGTARICKRPPAPTTKMPPPPPPRPPSPPPMPPPPPPRTIPSACKKARSGCDCRSTWSFRGLYYSYCASPLGDGEFWCQVSSSCSFFNNSLPYHKCAANLTVAYCGGRVTFSTTRVAPAPPSPPPSLYPQPPPAPTGPVATVSGQVVINASCGLLSTNLTGLRDSLLEALAQALQVSKSYINITSMACGSIIVDYVVSFPAGATISQVNSVAAAAGSLQSNFASTWGGIISSKSTGVNVFQPSVLCGAESGGFCSPPPPPPSQSSSIPVKWVVIGVVAGVVGVVLLALVVIVIVVYTKRKPRVAPNNQLDQQQRSAVTAAWTSPAGGSTQSVPASGLEASPVQPEYQPAAQYPPAQYPPAQYPPAQYPPAQYPPAQYTS